MKLRVLHQNNVVNVQIFSGFWKTMALQNLQEFESLSSISGLELLSLPGYNYLVGKGKTEQRRSAKNKTWLEKNIQIIVIMLYAAYKQQ